MGAAARRGKLEMAALAKAGRHEAVLAALARMRAAGRLRLGDAFAFTLAISSSGALRRRTTAAAFHAHAAKSGLLPGSQFIASALISAYSKCSSASAHNLFDELPERNPIVWAAAIAAHARGGDVNAAAALLAHIPYPPPPSAFNAVIASAGGVTSPLAAATLHRMHALGLTPTLVTVLALLKHSPLVYVRQIHCLSLRHCLLPDPQLCSTLVEAYGRCGCSDSAARTFHASAAADRDVVTWSALVSAYAINGCCSEATAAFQEMVSAGVRPDRITFLALFKACSHAGRPDEAQSYMAVMVSHYGIQPEPPHLACLVDALARAGQLEAARHTANRVPGESSTAAWGALLNAARVHGDVKVAEAAAQALARREPGNAANLVLLSGAYAGAGMAHKAAEAQGEIRARRLARAPGTSWVLLNDNLHARSV